MIARSKSIWGAWGLALLVSVWGVVHAFSDAPLPDPPELDARIVAGLTERDVAALRAGEPGFAVVKLDTSDDSPTGANIVATQTPGDEDGFEWTREDAWHLATLDSDTVGFTPVFERAQVRVRSKDGSTPCRRSGDRHICGEEGWQWVGPTQVRVNGRDRHCIWAHPQDGRTLEIEYRGVLGGPWILRAALADRAIGTGNPVEVSVRLGTKRFQHVHPDRRGFTTLKLPRVDEPTNLVVGIRADDVGRRHFCFEVTQ